MGSRRNGRNSQRAQGLTEYLIVVALIAIVAIIAVGRYGSELDAIIQGTDGSMQALSGGGKAGPLVNLPPAQP